MSGTLDVRTSVAGLAVWVGEVLQLYGLWQPALMWLGTALVGLLLLHRERRPVPTVLVVVLCLLVGVLCAAGAQARGSVPESLHARSFLLELRVERAVKESSKNRWSMAGKLLRVDGVPSAAKAIVMLDAPLDAPIGARVRLRGTVGPGGTPLTYFVAVRGPPTVMPATGLQAAAAGFRARLLGLTADREGGALVAGLAVGDESRQGPELAEQMQSAGLAHLTAVSGGNIAIVLLLTLGVARFATRRVAIQVVVGAAAILGYAFVVGPQPSLLRASVMGAVLVVSLLRGGPTTGLPALGTATWLLLLADPALAISLGFLLSVVATAGLVLFTLGVCRLMRALPGLRSAPRGFVQAIAVAPVAYFATLPVLASHGLATSWAAIPANLLAAPAVPVVTVSGLLSTVASGVHDSVVQLVLWPGLQGGRWIGLVAAWLGG